MVDLETFGEELLDNDRTSFTYQEAEVLAEKLECLPSAVIKALKDFGFTMETREPEKKVRGFRSNNNDRWSAYPSHGGSGHEQINGFAGEVG
jgi:hypothetical protein